MLGKHRDQLPEPALADAGAGNLNVNDGASVNAKEVIQRIVFGMELAVDERDLCLQPVLVRVTVAQALQCPAGSVRRDPVSPMQVGDVAKPVDIVAGGPLHLYIADDGGSARLDLKAKLHLLRAGIGKLLDRNLRLVVPVFPEHILDQAQSPIHGAAGIKPRQPETRSISELGVAGSSRSAPGRYHADEIVGGGPVHQIDFVAAVLFGFHGKIGKSSGGIQSAHAVCQLNTVERLSRLERELTQMYSASWVRETP